MRQAKTRTKESSMSTNIPCDTSTSLTADMVAQYTYCPRRMHLMYVDGRWGDNIYTEEGRSIHARTDAEDDPLPTPSSADG